MAYRTRIKYTAAQRADIWDRWQRGESLNSIGRLFDRPSSSVFTMLAPTGGIRPPPRRRSRLALTLAAREEISRCIACDLSLRAIAMRLGRAPSTVSREVNRNGGLRRYRASKADEAAWNRAHRPKPCKLVSEPVLSRLVARKLRVHCVDSHSSGVRNKGKIIGYVVARAVSSWCPACIRRFSLLVQTSSATIYSGLSGFTTLIHVYRL